MHIPALSSDFDGNSAKEPAEFRKTARPAFPTAAYTESGGTFPPERIEKRMDSCIVVPSVTYAQKARSVLRSRGIPASIGKQAGLSRHGCAWCVRVRNEDVTRTLALFAETGVRTTGEIHDVSYRLS